MTSPASEPILILGAGRVGVVLGTAWARAGYPVTFAAREPDSAKTQQVVGQCGSGVTARSVDGSAERADIVVVATPWTETQRVIHSVGDLTGKILIDATNPIVIGADELSRGLLVGHTTSAAEEIARWVPARASSKRLIGPGPPTWRIRGMASAHSKCSSVGTMRQRNHRGHARARRGT